MVSYCAQYCTPLIYLPLGLRIAQVHVVFQIPTKVLAIIFPTSNTAPTHLAYVEWFSAIPCSPDLNSGLYKVSRMSSSGSRKASIIPVDSITSSVNLIPHFVGSNTHDWNTFSVMELCCTFYINPFSDRDMYLVFA